MMDLNRFTVAGVAALTFCSCSASAQFGDGLTQSAIAIQSYEKSADRCAYEPIVGQALNRLRDHYAETEPYRWQRALRESKDVNDIVGNAVGMALQGSPYTADPRVSGPPKPAAPRDTQCVGSGLAVGAALPFAAALIGFDQTLFAEANRLMEGEGRLRPAATTTIVPRTDLAPLAPSAPNSVAGALTNQEVTNLSRDASPISVVRNFVNYGVTGREKLLVGNYSEGATVAMRALFSKGFVRDWEHAWATGENVFDASIVTGLPSVASTTAKQIWLDANTGDVALVTGVLTVKSDGEVINRDQSFLLLREDGAWKIDEIVYDRKDKALALHSILAAEGH